MDCICDSALAYCCCISARMSGEGEPQAARTDAVTTAQALRASMASPLRIRIDWREQNIP